MGGKRKEMKNYFSIIIPTYNSEKYIRRCLDSMLGQTNQNYEIIIVDDASTDKSSTIIYEYMKENQKIKYIHLEENVGPGIARNIGIEHANYEHILFCDSDDYFEPNLLSRMDGILIKNKDIDIIHFRGNTFRETAVLAHYEMEAFILYDNDTIIDGKNFLKEKGHEIVGSIYFTLFKTKFLKDNNLKFVKSSHMEDLLFMYQALYEAKKIYCINDKLYNRVYRPNSLTTSGQTRKRLEELVYITDAAYNYLKNHSDIYHLFYRFLIWACLKTKSFFDIDYSVRILQNMSIKYKDFNDLHRDSMLLIKETIDGLERRKMGKYTFNSKQNISF